MARLSLAWVGVGRGVRLGKEADLCSLPTLEGDWKRIGAGVGVPSFELRSDLVQEGTGLEIGYELE